MCNKAAKSSNDNGAVFVEFAIGFLLFLVLLFGIIDLGMMYHRRSEQEYAANQVVQFAAVVPGLEDSIPQNVLGYDVAKDSALEALRQRASDTLGTSSGFKLGKTATFSDVVTSEHLTTGTLIDENGLKKVTTGIKGSRDGEIVADSALYQQVSYPICKASVSDTECDDATVGDMTVFLPVRTKTIATPDIKEALKEEPVISVMEFSSSARLNLIKFFHPDNAKIRIFASAYREISQDSNMPLAVGCDGQPLNNGQIPAKCPISTATGMTCAYDSGSRTYKITDENCECDTTLGYKPKPEDGACVCRDNSEFSEETGTCNCINNCDSENGWRLDNATCTCYQETCAGDGTVISVGEGEDKECSLCLCPEGYVGSSITTTTTDNGEEYSCDCQNCIGRENMYVNDDGICDCKLKPYEEGSDDSDPDMCKEDEMFVQDDEGCRCVKCGENSQLENGVCVCEDGYLSQDGDGTNCSACDDSREGEVCYIDNPVGQGLCANNKGQLECVVDEETQKSKLDCVVNADVSKAETESCGDTEDKNCDGVAGAPIFCCKVQNPTDPEKQCVLLEGFYDNACPNGYTKKVKANVQDKCARDVNCDNRKLICSAEGKPTCEKFENANLKCTNSKFVGSCRLGKRECLLKKDAYGNEYGVYTSCEYNQPSDEGNICDNIDNDCDGLVDEGIECSDHKVCSNDRYKDKKCVCDEELLKRVCPATYNLADCSCGPLCKENEIVVDGRCVACGKNASAVEDDETGKKVCKCDNPNYTIDGNNKCSCKTRKDADNTESALACYRDSGTGYDINKCDCGTGCEGKRKRYVTEDGKLTYTKPSNESKIFGVMCSNCAKGWSYDEESNKCKCTAENVESCACTVKPITCYEKGKVFNRRGCGCGSARCNDDMTGIDTCMCPEWAKDEDGGCVCPANSIYKKTGESYNCLCDEKFMGAGGCSCSRLNCNSSNAPTQALINPENGALECSCGDVCDTDEVADGDSCAKCADGGIAIKDEDTGKWVCGCENDVTYDPEKGCVCDKTMMETLKAACNANGHIFDEENCKCETESSCIVPEEGTCGYTADETCNGEASPEVSGSCNANDSGDYCYKEGELKCVNHEILCVPVEGGRSVKKECTQDSTKNECKKVPACLDDEPWVSCDYADAQKALENCCGDTPKDCSGYSASSLCNWKSTCDKTTGKYKECLVYSKKSNMCSGNQYLYATSGTTTCECRNCANFRLASEDHKSCYCPEDAAQQCKIKGQILNSSSCKCVPCSNGLISRDGINCVCGLTALNCHAKNMIFNENDCACESCPSGRLNRITNTCSVRVND